MRSSCTLFAAIPFTLLACHASAATSRAASDARVAPIASELNPFGIPRSGAPLLCRRIEAPRSSPPGVIAYEFEDGRLSVDERVMHPLFDSTGRPLFITITANETLASGEPAPHALAIYFHVQPYYGLRVLHPESRQDNTTEPLTPSAVAQAHELAIWLWNHRCFRNAPAPT